MPLPWGTPQLRGLARWAIVLVTLALLIAAVRVPVQLVLSIVLFTVTRSCGSHGLLRSRL